MTDAGHSGQAGSEPAQGARDPAPTAEAVGAEPMAVEPVNAEPMAVESVAVAPVHVEPAPGEREVLRVDVVTIFPEYLTPLELSLIGRARRSGLLRLVVHDLRDWAADRHRTVDGPPAGGGAGMVMRPEPWGESLNTVLAAGRAALDLPDAAPTLLVPAPSGRPFGQALARELSRRRWLLIACGRYEGIDERVLDEAAQRMPVIPVSLGDYVLSGGEVAALAMIEAIGRLLPGVLGNAASLVEESHQDGLLEYPVYTRPASWRGREVPAVLLSGDHARVHRWRRDQRLRRTARRRPDLLTQLPVDLLDAADLAVLAEEGWTPAGAAPAPGDPVTRDGSPASPPPGGDPSLHPELPAPEVQRRHPAVAD